MIITSTAWPGSSLVQPAIERPIAMQLAQTEYQRVADAVDALKPEDWTRPTDCTGHTPAGRRTAQRHPIPSRAGR